MKYVDFIESFEDLKNTSWSGAINTLEKIEEEGKYQELMDLLEELGNETEYTRTQINDMLWFDDSYIYESLGIEIEEE